MSMLLEGLVREDVFETHEVSPGAELFSFLLIGAGAVLGFVLLSGVALGLQTGLADWVTSALCYGLFILPAYFAHRRYAFTSQAPHWKAFPVYMAVQMSGIALAVLFSWLAYGVVALPTVPAALTVIVLTSGINFFLLRAWAFGRKD